MAKITEIRIHFNWRGIKPRFYNFKSRYKNVQFSFLWFYVVVFYK